MPGSERHPAYLNWDDPKIPSRLRRGELPPNEPLVVLDEIHKYARWRNLVKGLYDTERSFRRFLVTGSARLDHYRKGGDSLANRYRYFRLHPFSWPELVRSTGRSDANELEALLRFGGFPEPLFRRSDRELRIWQRDRMSRVVRDDLRDLERVREISLVEQLAELLPEKVGSPLSIKSLREELYLWDWSMVSEPGPRFENMVASQLLKYCHWLEDTEGYRMELLRFIRDTDRREVDFVVIKDRKPQFGVECKTGEKSASAAARYFAERTNIPVFYQVHLGRRRFQTGSTIVLPFIDFCAELSLP